MKQFTQLAAGLFLTKFHWVTLQIFLKIPLGHTADWVTSWSNLGIAQCTHELIVYSTHMQSLDMLHKTRIQGLCNKILALSEYVLHG